MAGMGKNLVEGFNNGLSDEWSSVVTFFDKSFENIRNTFTNTWNNISENTTETWNGIKNVASDKFTELKDTLSTTTDNLKTNLSTGWENIKTIASQKWQELKTNTETAYSNLKNNLQNTDFGSVGTNLVNGLKQGIQNAWNGLKTFVGNLASGLTSTLNNTFGIHSPSKVWAETGLYLDEGLLSGLENGEKDVLSMVSDLAKNVSSEVGSEKATLNFDIASNGVLEQITSIADRLSDIALQFRAINTFLTDAGNFNIPIIASGTEIPYKTRIAAETPGTSAGSIADGIDERLYDQTYILRQILELIRRFKGVDGDALLRAIESLRSADRSYGV